MFPTYTREMKFCVQIKVYLTNLIPKVKSFYFILMQDDLCVQLFLGVLHFNRK